MKLKVCGMKFPENIEQLAAAQPDYMGFIFFEKSKRNFEGVIPKIPASIKKTGVFVNEYIEIVISLTEEYQLQAIQLHGEESVSYIEKLKSYLPKIELIKVFSIQNTFDFSVLEPYLPLVDYFLFDTKGKERGGNGVKFNWSVLNDYPFTKPYFLSGGIGLTDVSNIKDFVTKKAAKFCVALDINSQFEEHPGFKNNTKVKQFKQELGIS